MVDGKMKAITFSYDDGVTQDIRLIEIFNKYNLKCTFNLNSALLGNKDTVIYDSKSINHTKIKSEDVKYIYAGHEVAVHTLTHTNLTNLKEEEIIRQVEDDRKNLSELVGNEVVGMAYPCGGINNDDRVAEVIKNNTGVRFSRTITSSYSFDLQDNLYRFNPTVYDRETKKMFELAEQFLNMKTNKLQVFYIWGHSYELDIDDTWEQFDEFCKLVSGRKDIFYGTNSEILLAN